jgi:hypothetical protein
VIHVIVIVCGFLFGMWVENRIERCASVRKKIKSHLPRRVG